jgi:4-hydroxy 2-oxovalerate aldolase
MLKVLDCTLRDGGYYNEWDFEPEVVGSYLKAMGDAKIDYVELGLRNFTKPGFFGAFAFTTEEYLNRLDLPVGPKYGVMVDAKTILSSGLSINNAVDELFVDSAQSKIDLVRVAAHFHEVDQSGEIVKALKNKGYLVGFNLMQSAGKPFEVIAEKARLANSWAVLDVLYFADSLGNMDANEVKRIVNAIRQEWSGEIGIHTHNNMARALDNSMVAKSLGVNWIDSTITGMGRGAGNAQTENLLAVLSQDTDKYHPSSVYELAIKFFEPLQKKSGWGSNLMYFLGAQHNVHPTYIQNLLSDTHYGTDEIIGAIEYLKNLETSSSYDLAHYKKALSSSGEFKTISGSNELVGIAQDREVLLIANGPSLSKYLSDIEAYIKTRNPTVIAINVNELLNADLIDYYCISHNTKFLSEKDKYNTLRKPLIIPKHRFSDEELMVLEGKKVVDFGVEVELEQYKTQATSCVIPFDLTTAYALSVAKISGSYNITLVGFDGYEFGDERQLEMIEVITLFKSEYSNVMLTSLTPTTYPIAKSSVYAPIG